MNTPEKCPKCGDPLKDGWDNVYQCGSAFYTEGAMAGRFEERQSCVRLQRDQLATNLSALESAYAECAEKLYRAEQREHDLRRRLEDMRKQRDAFQSVATDPHALWSNWLRGDIQLPAGIGDIRECSEKMKRFRSRWLAVHQELRKAEDYIELLKSEKSC